MSLSAPAVVRIATTARALVRVAALAILGGWLASALPPADAAGDSSSLSPRNVSSFGDWRADAPGVAHRVAPGDLPAPFDTPSSGNGPEVVPRPRDAVPRVPAGFAVSRWAGGLSTPRVLRRAPNGDIFIAESGAGRILVMRPSADGGRPASVTVFASGLSLPFGIAFAPPANPAWVYVADTDRVLRFPYRAGDLNAGGPAETVLAGLPEGGHWTRDLATAPDGTLYLSVGSQSNYAESMPAAPPGGITAWEAAHGVGAAWGDESGRAAVFTLDPARHSSRPFATGLRNCVGLAIEPGSGAPWCATNERDGLGDNLPPDYVTSVGAGGFYGWPWYFIGPHEDPRLHGARPDLAGRATVPDLLIQPHSAPLGLTFYDGASFPSEYRGDAFVALHGSWNRATRTGYKVVRIRMRDGKPANGGYEDFLTGFVTRAGAVWGRPVDVAVMRDGSLLVSEDAGGTIWRVAWSGRARPRR